MSYNIVDLLDKLIKIEENGHKMYVEIGSIKDNNERVKLVTKILASEEEKHVDLYRNLKEKITTETLEQIDFDIYDKASKLVSRFAFVYLKNSMDIKALLEFALAFEKEHLALLVSIQGLFVRTMKDVSSNAYNILTEIIKEEEKHIHDIQVFLK